jgi:CDP-glycerol glycerophosphotransferase
MPESDAGEDDNGCVRPECRSIPGRKDGSVRRVLRRLLARLIELANRVTPKAAHAVVHGFPNTEGNAVEVIRALRERYRGAIVWLDGPAGTEFGPRVRSIPRSSLHGVLHYLTAEVVFFTHGLYGDPSPSPGQVIVNLWHGDGPKQDSTHRIGGPSPAPSTFIVGSTALFTERKAQALGIAAGGVLLTGNPRTDQFFRAPRADGGSLGIGLEQPFVMWLPTFRRSRPVGLNGARVGPSSMSDAELDAAMAAGVRSLTRAGVAVVVKRHPLDSNTADIPGARVVRDQDIQRAGLTLYEVLAASHGLITDYSSVWTDYLLLDRPIGFVAPDEADFTEHDLYPADILNWVPGIRLRDEESFRRFAADVLSGGRLEVERRRRVEERLGLVRTSHGADDLLAELDRRGAFRRSGGLAPTDRS